MHINRRHLLVSAIAASALSILSDLSSSLAQSPTHVKLRLNWLLGGAQAPFRFGEVRGYYRDAGIDLEILEGRGAGITAQAVGAKSELFGLADAGAVIAAISKGVPIRVIMAIEGVDNWGIIVRADRGISKPSDLKGKTVAMTAGDAPSGIFPAFLELNGLKPGDVRRAMMDPGAKKAVTLAGTVDGFLGHISDAVHIDERGVPTTVLRYADFGVAQVGTTVIAHVDTIDSQPDLVRRFVAATQRSWLEAIAVPKEVISVVGPTMKGSFSESTMLTELKNAIAARSSEAAGKPFGYVPEKGWATTVQMARTYLGINPSLPDTDMYTNKFVLDSSKS